MPKVRAASLLFAALTLAAFFSSCVREGGAIPETAQQTENEDTGDGTDDMTDALNTENASHGDETGSVLVTVGDKSFSLTLADTEAAREFAALLPLTLDMSELNGNEKYFYLEEKLSSRPAVPDMIHSGDLMLYGSSCVVIFYDDFETSYSYTPLGTIDDKDGLADTLGKGSVTVTFEKK